MKKGFFEGWYFKVQKGEHTLAAIPGYRRSADGEEEGFLQLMIDRHSYYFTYPIHQFSFMEKPYEIIVDKCIFTKRGASFFLREQGLCIKGDLGFGPLSELSATRFCPDIMGPFSYFPFLQCRHGILSMGHTVTGSLTVNGQTIDFTGGSGYLEKDSGVSFPDEWLWTQCNQFDTPCRMMLASATVPMLGIQFQGVIGVVMAGGIEYRLATYNGAKLKRAQYEGEKAEIEVANRRHRLCLSLEGSAGQDLLAPVNGEMSRKVRESITCRMELKLFDQGKLAVQASGCNAGFEWQRAMEDRSSHAKEAFPAVQK